MITTDSDLGKVVRDEDSKTCPFEGKNAATHCFGERKSDSVAKLGCG